MKKVITIIGIFGLMMVQAQVGISTDTPHESSDLELGSSNKALLLNRVSSEADITTSVEGMLIFNTTQHCFKGYQNGAWIDITTCATLGGVTALDCANAVLSSTPQANVAYTGTLSTSYTGGNGGVYGAQSINSTGVTGLTANISAGTLANDGGTLEYSVSGTAASAGTASFAINIAGQTCTVSVNITEPTPPTIKLQGDRYFVASVYDTDYHPYSNPTGSATIATNVAANGTTDPTIDIQGRITTAGISVKIPVTATASGTLPAYSTTITIPANMTENNIARNITLSWASQAYTTATKTINATIKAELGDLLAKKLDIQTGIGNDALGILMGEFILPNSAGTTETYQVRDIAVIPDRRFIENTTIGGVTQRHHDFLYLPVVVKGINSINGQAYEKIWLNLNLGAEYGKYSSTNFNVSVNKTGSAAHSDAKTYGSLFQWQRKADGHEFRNSQTTSTLATSWAHTSTSFITTSSSNYNWVSNGSSATGSDLLLWRSGGSNNPCPVGYHIPTHAEWQDLHEAITGSRTNISSSVFWNQSILPNFAAAGYRYSSDGTLYSADSGGYYWSSESYSINNAWSLRFNSIYSRPDYYYYRSLSHSARCLKD